MLLRLGILLLLAAALNAAADVIYCQNPDYDMVYNLSTGMNSEMADDLPAELEGTLVGGLRLWLGEWYGWREPDGVRINFYHGSCPPELDPFLGCDIPWSELDPQFVHQGLAAVYEITAWLPEPVMLQGPMSLGVTAIISWGSDEPFCGLCAGPMYEHSGCGPAYMDGENWGYTRWTPIDSFTGIDQDLAFCLLSLPTGLPEAQGLDLSWSQIRSLY